MQTIQVAFVPGQLVYVRNQDVVVGFDSTKPLFTTGRIFGIYFPTSAYKVYRIQMDKPGGPIEQVYENNIFASLPDLYQSTLVKATYRIEQLETELNKATTVRNTIEELNKTA